MQNYKAPGDTLTVTAPYELASGAGCKVGAIFGVACDDSVISVDVEIKTEGVFELVKDAGTAWVQGDKIYWDDSAKECDVDSAAGMLIGYATAAAASDAVVGNVKLIGAATDMSEGAQAAVVTLTDSTGVSGSHDDTIADGLTAVAPAAYTAHSAGAVAVTSNAATDLDTTAAAVANLRGVVASLVTDVTTNNQNVSDLTQKVIEILNRLVAAGIIDA